MSLLPLFTAGSSSAFVDQQEAVGHVPAVVLDSWDWAVRTDNGAPAVHQSRASQDRFAALVEERRRILVPFETRVPWSYGFDMAYVRWRREVPYVQRLWVTLQWLDSHDCGEVDDRCLLCDTTIHPGTWATSYLDRNAAREGRFDDDWTMPLRLRVFERKERHRTNHLVPAHCQEATSIRKEAMSRRFVPAPWWWKFVEVSWSMRAELPALIAYLSRLLIANPDHRAWRIVRTEWAFQVAKDLIYQARDGRLFWISTNLRQDMMEIGVARLLRDSETTVHDQLQSLIRYVDELRWSECPEHYRVSAPEVSGQSPVFVTGDYFPFDAERWVPNVEDFYLIPRDGDGGLAEPLSHPGRRAGDGAWRLASENHAHGNPRGTRRYHTSAQRRSGQAGRDQIREGRISGPARGQFRGNQVQRGRSRQGGTGLRSRPLALAVRDAMQVEVPTAEREDQGGETTDSDPIVPDATTTESREEGEVDEATVLESQRQGLRERYGLGTDGSTEVTATTTTTVTNASSTPRSEVITPIVVGLQGMTVSEPVIEEEDIPEEWLRDLEEAEASERRVTTVAVAEVVDLTVNNEILPSPSRPVTLAIKREVALQGQSSGNPEDSAAN